MFVPSTWDCKAHSGIMNFFSEVLNGAYNSMHGRSSYEHNEVSFLLQAHTIKVCGQP